MKKILIVGATSAIGGAVLDLLVDPEVALYLVGRNGERLDALAKDATLRGVGGVQSLEADLALEQDYNRVEKWLGEIGPVDEAYILPGVLTDEDAAFESARADLSVNFLSPALISRTLLESMAENSGGAIVVVGSVAGDRGRQSNALYGAQKGALEIFMAGLTHRAFHHSRKVRVIFVKPGFVKSPMTSHLKQGPLFSEPEVVAKRMIKMAEGGRSRVCYAPFWWGGIMAVIRLVPNFVFWRSRL